MILVSTADVSHLQVVELTQGMKTCSSEVINRDIVALFALCLTGYGHFVSRLQWEISNFPALFMVITSKICEDCCLYIYYEQFINGIFCVYLLVYQFHYRSHLFT